MPSKILPEAPLQARRKKRGVVGNCQPIGIQPAGLSRVQLLHGKGAGQGIGNPVYRLGQVAEVIGFGVAIGKAPVKAIRMHPAGRFHAREGAGRVGAEWVNIKLIIVDGKRVLVHKHKQPGGREKLRFLLEKDQSWRIQIPVASQHAAGIHIGGAVHVTADRVITKSVGVGDGRSVSWTLVGGQRFEIRPKCAGHQRLGTALVKRRRPINRFAAKRAVLIGAATIAGSPRGHVHPPGCGHGFTRNDAPRKVAVVHGPDQRELMHVIGAVSSLAVHLGVGQTGQQERSQNRDDGDDHQQFNQSERPGQRFLCNGIFQ